MCWPLCVSGHFTKGKKFRSVRITFGPLGKVKKIKNQKKIRQYLNFQPAKPGKKWDLQKIKR